ncbi:MAG: hypothetical protein V3W20_09275 [Candidatus Neomarinimicrobiota bacterium]
MPRLRTISITDSNAYAAVKNGDDLLFHKVKPKINDIHWWIQLISWTDHVAKAIWLEKDGVPELHAIGTYKYIALIKRWGKWREKVRYAVLYVPIEVVADEYKGTNIYWGPLSGEARSRFNDEEFKKVCDEMEGVPYDYWQLAGVGIDDEHINWLMRGLKYLPFYKVWWGKFLKRIFKNREIISKVVCSGFTSYCDRRSMKAIIKNVSEETPQDQAMRGIHDSNYYQLLGDHLLIPDYNTKTVFYNE